jgi:hypothetical protein
MRINLLAFLLLIFSAAWLGSCSLFDKDEPIPAYIHIDSISLNTDFQAQGTAKHKITDAWVYIDDQLIGAFELPVTLPVLFEGTHEIKVRAGVKMNGIAATRVIYPFYNFYISNINLVAAQVTTVQPNVGYFSGTIFEELEAFESAGHIFIDTSATDTTLQIIQNPPDTNVFEGFKSGASFLDSTHLVFQMRSPVYPLQADGQAKFIELHYKTNNAFTVGYIFDNINYTVVGVNASPGKWNKIYINLTDQVLTSGNYQIYIAAIKTPDLQNTFLYLDNFKFIRY